MDKTETYIKMCDCPEIQGLFLEKLKTMDWEYNHISVIWGRKGIGGLVGTMLIREPIYGLSWEVGNYHIYNGKIRGEHCKHLLSSEDPKARVIWLPRQDQLQEMIEFDSLEKYWVKRGIHLTNWHIVESRLNRFYDFTMIGLCRDTERLSEYCVQFTSMEQLWLAFVMKEKHSKVWDGEKWSNR